MRAIIRNGGILALAALLAQLTFFSAAEAQPEPTIEISPAVINIGSFYHGTTVTCTGSIPRGQKAAVILRSVEKEQHLSRKDRVGPLWMNVETVTISGTPEMYYLLLSTGGLDGLAGQEALENCCIGYGAMRKMAGIKQDGPNLDATFAEFIRLEESLGYYRIAPDSITLKPLNEQTSRFEGSFQIPPSAPPGEYKVFIYSFSDDGQHTVASTDLIIQKAGMPQMVWELAYKHAALYGLLSIVIAIAAGLSMGVVFGGKAKGGH